MSTQLSHFNGQGLEERFTGLFPRLALAALGTLAGLGLLAGAEATARALRGNAPDPFAQLHEYSEVYGWTPRSGARMTEDGQTLSVNPRGYRGRLVESRPGGSARRVLMLGDSIAFGLGVGDGETFSDLLDSRENGLEVVNLAVQGYGLGQSLLKLEHEGFGLSPDVVVLNVCLANDVADTVSRTFLYDGRHPKPYFEIEDGRLALRDEHLNLRMTDRVGRELARHSRLFSWLTGRPGLQPDAEGDVVEHWLDRKQRLETTPWAAEICRRILARMRELTEAHGARFVVLLHPDWGSYSHGLGWQKAIFSAPELDGVTVVSLRRHYLGTGIAWKRFALDGAGHLSPTGHSIVADLIEDQLRTQTPQNARASAAAAQVGAIPH